MLSCGSIRMRSPSESETATDDSWSLCRLRALLAASEGGDITPEMLMQLGLAGGDGKPQFCGSVEQLE